MGEFLYEELTQKIIGAAFAVHNSLGKGMQEKTYENALLLKLRKIGLKAEAQKFLPVFFENEKVGEQQVDILVENKIIVELKAIDHCSKRPLSPAPWISEEYTIPVGLAHKLWRKSRN